MYVGDAHMGGGGVRGLYVHVGPQVGADPRRYLMTEALKEERPRLIAEIDALRSELEAMRPVVEAACDLMAPFQWTTAGMNRLREAVGAYRDSRPERLCVAEGHMTVGPEGAFHDPDEGPCEWADSSRSVRNGE